MGPPIGDVDVLLYPIIFAPRREEEPAPFAAHPEKRPAAPGLALKISTCVYYFLQKMEYDNRKALDIPGCLTVITALGREFFENG